MYDNLNDVTNFLQFFLLHPPGCLNQYLLFKAFLSHISDKLTIIAALSHSTKCFTCSTPQ